MTTGMPREEHEKYEKALSTLEALSMRANSGDLSWDEGRFLNMFGKAMGMFRYIWRVYYPLCGKGKETQKYKAMEAVAAGYRIAGEKMMGKEFTP